MSMIAKQFKGSIFPNARLYTASNIRVLLHIWGYPSGYLLLRTERQPTRRTPKSIKVLFVALLHSTVPIFLPTFSSSKVILTRISLHAIYLKMVSLQGWATQTYWSHWPSLCCPSQPRLTSIAHPLPLQYSTNIGLLEYTRASLAPVHHYFLAFLPIFQPQPIKQTVWLP